MVLQLFSLPCEEKTIQESKLGEITEINSFEFEKRFCGAGTFSLEIPSNCNYADIIEINTLIYSREDNMCFVAKNIKRTETTTTITGYDLNVMLRDRLTMPAVDEKGVMGEKDLIQGTTEACVKHFIDYNMINSLVPERNYPRFAIGEDKGRGLAADSYYCGKQSVEDVVCALCEGASLGYRISLDISPKSTSPETPLIIFDVAEQVDKSANQSERNRVIFSAGMKNINQTERETGITSNKNALWCEAGGIHDGFVFESDEEAAPASWDRREEYVSLSVADKDSEADLKLYGRREMTDKFAITDSLVVEAGNPLDFGVVYDVGDIITVYDNAHKVQLDSVISAATVKRSGSEYTVKITLGESKPKLIDECVKQSDLLKKNQRDYPAANDGQILHTLGSTTSAATVSNGDASSLVIGYTGNNAENPVKSYSYAMIGAQNECMYIEHYYEHDLLHSIVMEDGDLYIKYCGNEFVKVSPNAEQIVIGAFKFTFNTNGVYIYNTIKKRGVSIPYTN